MDGEKRKRRKELLSRRRSFQERIEGKLRERDKMLLVKGDFCTLRKLRRKQDQEPISSKLRDSPLYRSWCEVCHSHRKWCGFDHEKKVFCIQHQADKHTKGLLQAQLAGLSSLDSKDKVLVRRIVQSLRLRKEKHRSRAGDARDQSKTAAQIFQALDTSQDGALDKKELEQGLHMMGLGLHPMDVAALFRIMDKDRSGGINLREFVEIVSLGLGTFEKVPGMLSKSEEWLMGEDRREDLRQRSMNLLPKMCPY